MRGVLFKHRDEVIDKFNNELKNLNSKDFNKAFDTWIKRCKRVTLKNGNYI